VQLVNKKKFDTFINDNREFDIITNKCIIEVKSGKVQRCLKQFLQQKRYADSKNKSILFLHQQYLQWLKLITKNTA